MEQFQFIVTRLKSTFSDAAPGQRTIMLAIPIILAISLLAASQSGAKTLVPLDGITRNTLTSAQQHFDSAGLTSYQVQGGRILVPTAELDRYRQVLSQATREPTSDWEQQFSKTGMFTTRDQLQAARDIALEKTIRRAILAVPAIDDVSVTWARSQQRRWNSQPALVTATVCVTPHRNSRITPQLSRSLQTAVASMIPDLQPDNVTVFDQSTGQSSGAPGTGNDVEIARRAMEDNYRQRILTALGFLPEVNVTVTAADADRNVRSTSVNERTALRPIATANSTYTSRSSDQSELHVSVYVSDRIYKALGKASGEKTRRELEHVVRRIVEPANVLASLHVGSIDSGITPAATAASGTPGLVATPASSILLIVVVGLAAIGIPMWWSRRLNNRSATQRIDELVQDSDIDDERQGEEVFDVVATSNATLSATSPATSYRQPVRHQASAVKPEPVVEPAAVAELDSVLNSHPHESLSVLKKWTQTDDQSAAAADIASRMQPAVAAQFAAKMSDDDRSRLHSALQPGTNSSTGNATYSIDAFCRQVAQAAERPDPPTPSVTETNSIEQKVVRAAKPEVKVQPKSQSPKPASRLYEFPPRLVARLLENEQPQIVAIAIAQLDSKSIEKILHNFTNTRSARIRERLDAIDIVPQLLRTEIQSVVLQQLVESTSKESA